MFSFEYVFQGYVFTVPSSKLMLRPESSWYTGILRTEFCPDNAESSFLFGFSFFTSDKGLHTSYVRTRIRG